MFLEHNLLTKVSQADKGHFRIKVHISLNGMVRKLKVLNKLSFRQFENKYKFCLHSGMKVA
jgi:hypothetical protein